MENSKTFINSIRTRIEREYVKSNNELGWRFLSSPIEVLNGSEIAFLGLNPGGSVKPENHAEFAMESGSAYVSESWKNLPPGSEKLQVQVRRLFSCLGIEPEKVLAGNLVPFRSRDWNSLRNRKASLVFGEELWFEIFRFAKPKLVVGMGNQVSNSLARILNAEKTGCEPINWKSSSGKMMTVQRFSFEGGVLVSLPHLSRFGIIGREKSTPALKHVFDGFWKDELDG